MPTSGRRLALWALALLAAGGCGSCGDGGGTDSESGDEPGRVRAAPEMEARDDGERPDPDGDEPQSPEPEVQSPQQRERSSLAERPAAPDSPAAPGSRGKLPALTAAQRRTLDEVAGVLEALGDLHDTYVERQREIDGAHAGCVEPEDPPTHDARWLAELLDDVRMRAKRAGAVTETLTDALRTCRSEAGKDHAFGCERRLDGVHGATLDELRSGVAREPELAAHVECRLASYEARREWDALVSLWRNEALDAGRNASHTWPGDPELSERIEAGGERLSTWAFDAEALAADLEAGDREVALEAGAKLRMRVAGHLDAPDAKRGFAALDEVERACRIGLPFEPGAAVAVTRAPRGGRSRHWVAADDEGRPVIHADRLDRQGNVVTRPHAVRPTRGQVAMMEALRARGRTALAWCTRVGEDRAAYGLIWLSDEGERLGPAVQLGTSFALDEGPGCWVELRRKGRQLHVQRSNGKCGSRLRRDCSDRRVLGIE